MPDIEKAIRFREHFNTWRGTEVASRKEPYILSAISISQFVDDNSFSSINTEIVFDSPIYKNFNENKSTIIFITLALMDYYSKIEASNNFARSELSFLNSIIKNLQDIATSPTKHSLNKINAIILNMNDWLNSIEFSNKDLALTKITLLSIYTVFRFLSIRIDHINGQEKAILKLLGIKQNDTKIALDLILEKLTLKISEIDKLINPIHIPDNVSEDSSEISAKWPLEHLFLNILRQDDTTLQQKITLIRDKILKINDEISNLINEKENREIINQQLDYCVKIISAINDAEKKGFSINLVIKLVNSNRNNFIELISHTTIEEQNKINADITKLESLSLLQKASNTMKYGLARPINLFYSFIHTYAPIQVQNALDYLSPIDLEQSTLEKLKSIAEARLTKISGLLKNSDINKLQIATSIANGDENLKQFLEFANRFKLEEIFSSNTTLSQILYQFEGFANTVLMNKIKLEEIRGLNSQIDKFIKKHDSFIVHLSLFLSNICSLFSYLFKTETAAKIEEVKIIQEELSILKTAYEASNTATLKKITANENISPKLKGEILDIISAEPIRPMTDTFTPNIITAFTKITTMFSGLISRKSVDEEDFNDEEELLLRRV